MLSLPQALSALLLAALVDGLIRLGSLRRACSLLGVPLVLDARPCPPGLPALSADEIRRVRVVRRVLDSVPWDGRCLRRSIVLALVLRHRHPVLRLGTALHPGGLVFHAWLEVGGLAVEGDGEGFVPLGTAKLASPVASSAVEPG